MEIKITNEESFVLHSLATTQFLAELWKNNFIQSEKYDKMKWSNESLKNLLKNSGIGNPATLQIMLYSLLVIPNEYVKKNKIDIDFSVMNTYIKGKSALIKNTYPKEQTNFNYIKHIRNSVAHGKISFGKTNKTIIFKDENPKDSSKYCVIEINSICVGDIITELSKLLLSYFNKYKS